MTFKRFEEIDAWQTARRLSIEITAVIRDGPLARDFSLRDQINATVNSMMANVAEGHSRRSDREFAHFLFTGKSSGAEFQSHLYTAFDRGYLTEVRFKELFDLAERYARQVSGLISYLTGWKKPGKQTGKTEQTGKTGKTWG